MKTYLLLMFALLTTLSLSAQTVISYSTTPLQDRASRPQLSSNSRANFGYKAMVSDVAVLPSGAYLSVDRIQQPRDLASAPSVLVGDVDAFSKTYTFDKAGQPTIMYYNGESLRANYVITDYDYPELLDADRKEGLVQSAVSYSYDGLGNRIFQAHSFYPMISYDESFRFDDYGISVKN